MTEIDEMQQGTDRKEAWVGGWGIVVFLAALAAMLAPLPSEAAIRIIYESGVVVCVDRTGNKVLDWQKIELPDTAKGVHSVAVDYLRHKVYVVEEAPSRHAAALILDLASLRRVGRITGVLRLHVPVSDEAPFLLVQRQDPRSGQGAEHGDPESIDSALYDLSPPSSTEFRSRSSPLRVASVAEGDQQWNDRHLCYDPHLNLYFDTNLSYGFDSDFKKRYPEAEGSWLTSDSLKHASLADCAPSGQMLLFVPQEGANDAVVGMSTNPFVDIVRWSSRESVRLRLESFSRNTWARDSWSDLLLGRKGEFVATEARLYRFDPPTAMPVIPVLGGRMERSDRLVVPEPDNGEYGSFILGRSHDGSEVYLGKREYHYRNIVTASRVLNPGAHRYLHSSVSRFVAGDDSVTIDDLDLPAATTAYRFRQMLIGLIESNEDRSEESRAQAIQELDADPWHGPWIQLDELAIAIGDSGVVGVIVDEVEDE